MSTSTCDAETDGGPEHGTSTFLVGGELPVRRLGYGTAQLTGPGYWGPRGDARDAVAVLRRAVERGVTLVDTADNYGPSVAEELVAEALHPYAEDLLIATKGGVVRTGDSAWHIAGRPEQLRAMCEASLRRLRLDTIGLYQLHRLDPDVPMAEQLGALDELRAEGKIRHIGLDTVTDEQLAAALELTDIASVQNRYNLLDRASQPLLELCEARGIAFLPWFPLGNGSLTSDPVCAGIAAAHGAMPGQVALAWLLRRSPVLCPTPGTGSLVHLEENLDAGAVRLTDEDMDRLDALADTPRGSRG
ncbi:aldo/keto reductase [Streptomyces sp. NPDC005813]|uniref:aldo/keto reductase n=1 Tax=Streptomyces sp. NPDC005813 TaxID=3155592 RepID=UPI0033EC77C8